MGAEGLNEGFYALAIDLVECDEERLFKKSRVVLLKLVSQHEELFKGIAVLFPGGELNEKD